MNALGIFLGWVVPPKNKLLIEFLPTGCFSSIDPTTYTVRADDSRSHQKRPDHRDKLYSTHLISSGTFIVARCGLLPDLHPLESKVFNADRDLGRYE
jgi:hypothetical protein